MFVLQIVAIVLCVAFFAYVVHLVARERLLLKYSLLWIKNLVQEQALLAKKLGAANANPQHSDAHDFPDDHSQEHA